ncbi:MULTISPECIES: phosphate acetyltransferase [Rathayibacter]|jgi:phosphate acetyltransferase|uniref:Phosphate acetyltransferase n=1 Tax=Rathayibacter festucae DSM 15932 TaxID=1328866 RepID=A0A3T0T234_9MICO|nr:MULTISPECIES: phosphate acetyltransferase [Rathayibacter]AZZ52610.1 phosphate acetyltransferase [Rathayibacter festucae DSM 15932]MCJ1704494.1 phosphate acetyltransferase [Rathayibacter sp. VKM Ac-2926]ROP45212.1 phosphate acetyltransferase [Rathayibacter sp. PhB186]ROQ03284.1 phosphate acetyltransferase [Rathayibacter sp. PhB93]ROQ55978.1 phosphate acetyltransferase [Rathayibacter sp. PhB152]
MVQSIYISSAEGHSGKSTVALGVLDLLSSQVQRVGVFRPIARSTSERDYVLEMLLGHSDSGLAYDDCIGVTYEDVHADGEAALSRIVERYKAVEAQCDTVVILGSDYTDVGSPTELGYNARIAANLGAPVLLVLTGRDPSRSEQLGQAPARTPDEMRQITELAAVELRTAHASLIGVVANRADPGTSEQAVAAIREALPSGAPVWAIHEDPSLVAPSVSRIIDAVDGVFVAGDPELLGREALGVVVAGMSMVNVLPRLMEGGVVIVPGDRPEVVLAVIMAHASGNFPTVSAIILNGGFELQEPIVRLIEGVDNRLPIVMTELGTYDTAVRVTAARGRLAADSPRKRDTSLALFAEAIDPVELLTLLDVGRSEVVTPLMFEYGLIERARIADRHIVLPEGGDDRILRAAATVLKRGIARLTILGEEVEVRSRAASLGLDIDGARVLSVLDPEHRNRFAEEYARIRAHKGITFDHAYDTVTDVSYFGTMMVQLGLADGMVSGAAHTTAHTIRPGFEIIKTSPGVSVVSSVFLMALADRVLVYGDCAVNPDPTEAQLADIAISSAETAQQFGIDPRIAMLSYSTGESGAGADVEKVRAATALVRERRPDLLVEGPIQYDAAADAAVAASKMPGSQVAGRATVFIFPDLNTGNNTYKAVQRSAGAVAIGPVLQGLRKPVNDLSRGALVQDIVNTVAITAIQAATQAIVPPTSAIPVVR